MPGVVRGKGGKGLFGVLCAVLLAAALRVPGQVTVVKPGGAKSVLNLSGFALGPGPSAAEFSQTLQSDLVRSGWFTVSAAGGAFNLVGVCRQSGRILSVECQVYQPSTGEYRLSKRYREQAENARALAHRVADDIVEGVTGRPGVAATRIAMIGKRGGVKEVYVCDADGGNLLQITHDKQICLGPNWGPAARSLVYTSFRSFWPDVYLLELERGRRTCVANYPGLNTTADISPDGADLVLTLSKDGNPDLYVKNLASGRLSRVTRTRLAGEASPSWSPDGREMVYVSDSSGAPQLYITGRDGGVPQRLTSRGSENVGPDWGADGLIAYSSRRDGFYQICVMDPRTHEERQITSEPVDHEDPSWAPDGRHIVFTRTQRHHADLYILDTMGDPPVRLTTMQGEWYSPAWSPK